MADEARRSLLPLIPLSATRWPCGCASEKLGGNSPYADRLYVCPEHQQTNIARPKWREIVFLREATAGTLPELGWCGNGEPHEGHEFGEGAARRDCPGICAVCRGTGKDGSGDECSPCLGAGCA